MQNFEIEKKKGKKRKVNPNKLNTDPPLMAIKQNPEKCLSA